MPKLYLDFETLSIADLELTGVHNYWSHESTRISLMAWALDDADVQVWEPHKYGAHFPDPHKFPDEVYWALKNPEIEIVSWNSTFERLGINTKLVTKHLPPVPINRFFDPMIQARHLALPGSLEKCCQVLKLGAEGKLDGDKLKALFCYPAHLGGDETLFGISEPRFNDENSHPVEWANFKEYVKHDVISMRKICKILKHHPLPQSELEGFWLDQKINDHGIPVDLELIQKMDKIAVKAKDIANKKIIELTGVENPNSRPQLLGWLKKEGYEFNSLGKPFVNTALDDIGLSGTAAEVLELRKESAKTSDSKLEALKNSVSPDNTIKDMFGYLGASRTGRWNAHGPQFANNPRPVKLVEKNFDLAIELIQKEDFEQIKQKFGSVMDVIAGCIRACYCAPEGETFLVADYSSIEPRILGWLTNCHKINEMFRKGEDVYLRFASVVFSIPYEEMVIIHPDGRHECKPEYKLLRQQAKPGFLGCGYMLSGGEEKLDKNGDTYRSGVWGYAESMGVSIDQELAHKSVYVFRKEYKEVCEFWYEADEIIKRVIKTRKPLSLGYINFDILGKTLRMALPSGRFLHYVNPVIGQKEFKGKLKDQIFFDGIDGKTKQWIQQDTHPGRVTENLVSGIARDVLLDGLKKADKENIRVCAHVHDEILALEKLLKAQETLKKLLKCMSTSPDWAPDLRVSAEGFCSVRYKKG
jgi:DNA polymerase bacteriophage-type